MDFLSKKYTRHYFHPQKEEKKMGLYPVGCGSACETEIKYKARENKILDSFGLVYLVSGTGKYRGSPGEKSTKLETGTIITIFPGRWHSYIFDRDSKWKEIWILFDGEYTEILRRNKVLCRDNPLFLAGLDSILLGYFSKIISLSERRPLGFMLEITTLIMQILARKEFLGATEKKVKGNPKIEKAVSILTQRCHENINISEMASSLGMGYHHFRRLFKLYTGISPHQYLLDLKMNRAKELLSEGTVPIKEISAALGFEDPYYFSRIFHKKTGMSPSLWAGM